MCARARVTGCARPLLWPARQQHFAQLHFLHYSIMPHRIVLATFLQDAGSRWQAWRHLNIGECVDARLCALLVQNIFSRRTAAVVVGRQRASAFSRMPCAGSCANVCAETRQWLCYVRLAGHGRHTCITQPMTLRSSGNCATNARLWPLAGLART